MITKVKVVWMWVILATFLVGTTSVFSPPKTEAIGVTEGSISGHVYVDGEAVPEGTYIFLESFVNGNYEILGRRPTDADGKYSFGVDCYTYEKYYDVMLPGQWAEGTGYRNGVRIKAPESCNRTNIDIDALTP